MYPDTYEVGAPNQGVQILYEVLNERADTLCERAYAVWPDMEAALRKLACQPSQSTRIARSPLSTCWASPSPPSWATNLLTTLDLAGIPLHADNRTREPLVIAGGHSAFNPEPIADFIDAAVLGDGEQAVGRSPTSSSPGRPKDRRVVGREVLARLAATGGVYVPRFYDVDYLPDGRIRRVAPNRSGVPWRITKHTVSDLDSWPYPKAPLVPLAETVHERASVEIFRGCTRGCRFCQAGMITRPVRERSASTVGQMVTSAVRRSGFEEVGLLSLSSADHSEIADIARGWPISTRAATPRCRCRPPGSMPSTSNSPTSCPATAVARV